MTGTEDALGSPLPAPGPPTTVDAALRQRVEQDPDGQFVCCDDELNWFSAAEVDRRSDRVAAGLARLGVGQGDRVAWILPNRIETIDILFAVAKLGAVQVPLNYFLKGDFLSYQLDDCEPKVLIADAVGLAAADGYLERAGVQQIVTVGVPEGANEPAGDAVPFSRLLDDEGAYRRATPDASDPITLMYTSGTTAAAKGCVLSTGYYVNVGRAYGMRGWVIPGDRVYTGFPMYHSSGQMVAFMSALVNDASFAVASDFHASTFMADAARAEATMLVGVGVMGAMILAQPPRPTDGARSFRMATWVPLPEAQQREFAERFKTPVMAEGYGQTECVPVTNTDPNSPRDPSTCGQPSPLLEVRIHDEFDNEVPLGGAGEIVVRPKVPNAMYSGYWRKPEETAIAWRNLWHHTGDFGRMDQSGAVSFVDRKKDIVRRRGENISSLSIELLIRELPAVADVAVSAVPADVGDDEMKASVVLAQGASMEPSDLIDHLRDRVAYFALPRYLDIRESLPANALGRIMKHVLRAEGTAGSVDMQDMGLVGGRRDRRSTDAG
ncbi:AMP-binding protein [Nakamurella lactea]|uniref:AMP-binding protein n=1 Tax=Nakamurella lactea TaxID=459515 RepID=UPI000419C545|nr:AMP-binding protein [Nakamurella lactea]